MLCVIGLNPSTATAEVNDPTIRCCIRCAEQWGNGGLLMLNLFAFRATLPADMWAEKKRGNDIIGGPSNYFSAMREYIAEYECSLVLAAWGNHGGDRGRLALTEIPNLHYLMLNADGSPHHPLYLPAVLKPTAFSNRVSK